MDLKNILFLIMILGMATVAQAEVPHVVNYQGRLIDDGGNPVSDGYYNLTFTLYDHPTESAGMLWTSGQQSVGVTNGLFTYALGSNVPFGSDLTADSSLWLGITMAGEAEMAPRTKMSTVPFAFRALVADEISEEGDEWINEAGDTIHGSLYFDTDGDAGRLNVSTVSASSSLDLREDGISTAKLYGTDYGTLYLRDPLGDNRAVLDASPEDGGYLYLYNNGNTRTANLNAGNITDTPGGYFTLCNMNNENYLQMMSDDNGAYLNLSRGSYSRITLNAEFDGTASVVLPEDAIGANEMLNEPGIAAQQYDIVRTLTSTTMEDIQAVTITIPTAGYIVVTAKAWGLHLGTNDVAYSYAQIDETAGGSPEYPYYTIWGFTQSVGGSQYESIYTQRVYYKDAGTYIFLLEACRGNTSTGAIHRIADPIVIATFYPTSYGDVATFVSSSEAGEFDNAEFRSGSRTVDGVTEYTETNVKVNLNELEIKAKRLREEIEKQQIELEGTERLMQMPQNQSESDRDER